jgi:hypothetical protein
LGFLPELSRGQRLSLFELFFSAYNLRVSRVLDLDPTALAFAIVSPVLPLRNNAARQASSNTYFYAFDILQLNREAFAGCRYAHASRN